MMYFKSLCKCVTEQAVLLRMKETTRLPWFLVPLKMITGKTCKCERQTFYHREAASFQYEGFGEGCLLSMLERDHCWVLHSSTGKRGWYLYEHGPWTMGSLTATGMACAVRIGLWNIILGLGEKVGEGMNICWPFVLINSLQTQVRRTANINTRGYMDLFF